ncbi:MAG: 50S ribosomal protein L15 [Candidatus Magasanikbacteria bacterium]|nr:50S ribosomal protein L15 [Candidatus Magasanikbacteria bacterium]
MTLTPATIKPARSSHRYTKRVGRGNASGRGTYSGRGGKGQTARSGGKSRRRIRAFKAALLRVPKLRGFKSLQIKKATVTLSDIERIAEKNQVITPQLLKTRGLIGNVKFGVKVVATGEIKKPIILHGCLASKKAVELIEKAGGQIKP